VAAAPLGLASECDVRLVLTLELHRVLAEQLAARGIRIGKNIEGVILALLEQGEARWR
jgi:uncharacterized lipoprotein YajG